MKKKSIIFRRGSGKLKKVWLMLKFTFVFMFAGIFQLYAHSQSVSLNMDEVTLDRVIWAIEKQTDFVFMYSKDDLVKAGKVSVNLKNATVESVLESCLENTGLTYVIQDGVIVLRPGRPQAVEKMDISGTIKDANGNTLPGVTVRLKGSALGVVSDVEGNFRLQVPKSQSVVLVFSFVGMKTIEMPVADSKPLSVVMQEDVAQMDEVVVTGYQILSRERATGSYDILSKEMLDKPVSNIASRLVGTVAGVQATVDENGDPTFQIRGKSSLYADAQPLVVVDGFPIEGNFKSINPNDVESVTVLKDAAAASIWGARSANGVIVVTTKSGSRLKKGDLRVSISSFVRYSPKTDLSYAHSVANSADAVEYDKFSFNKWRSTPVPDRWNSPNGPATSGKVALNEHYLGYLTDGELESILKQLAQQDNSQQIKDHILQNPFVHQYNLNIAGSSERASHYLSMMYEGRKRNLKGNEGEKAMVNYKMSMNLYKWLDFDFSGSYMYDRSTNNSEGIPHIMPYEMLLDEEGNRLPIIKTYYVPNMERYVPLDKFPYPNWTYYNPIDEMENRDLTTKQNIARFQAGLKLKFMDGLDLNAAFKYELNNSITRNYYGEETFQVRNNVNYYTYWNQDENTFTLNIPKGAQLGQSRWQTDVFNFRTQLNFDRSFGKHSIAGVAGAEITSKCSQYFGYTKTYGYNDEKLTVGTFPNGLGSNTNSNLRIYNWLGNRVTIYDGVNNAFSYSTNRFFSLYANVSYTYNSLYTLSGSVRTDASNLITDDPKYRYQPMWSLGGSWLLSGEEFMSGKEWIDRLTLRVTYGYNGNVDNSTSFKPLISLAQTNDRYTNAPYATVSNYGNPSLRWEKTGVLNIGVDYTLWGGKLHGKIDYYRKSAKDLIATISIPEVNGTGSQKINAANMTNHGIELEVGSSLDFAENWSWNGNLNVAYNKNKITKLFVAAYTHSNLIPWQGGRTAYVEGENANTIYGLKYAGLKNTGTEASPDIQPQIVDKNGVMYGLGSWPAGEPMDYCYKQGTTVAPWILGFSNTFKYRNWDFSFILTGKFGHVFRRESYNYNNAVPNAKLSEVLHGDPNEIMPLPQNDSESKYYFWNRFWPFFTYLTESANHVRLQEVSLTYTLPAHYMRRIGMSSLQVYGMANNVCSIYANKWNEDPEFPRGSVKPAPYFTFGVRIGL